MTEKVQVVFCDLDGTLVLDNSFHIFLASAWSLSGLAARFGLAARLAPRALGRAGGGHGAMKRRALVWFWQQKSSMRDAIVQHTIERLHYTLSQPVVALLDNLRQQGARIVLATAAPNIYAERMQTLIKAEACLATPSRPNPDWAELLGEAKARACRRWLNEQVGDESAPQVTVVTDHPDDLPLLRLADHAVLQGSARTIEQIETMLRTYPDGKQTQITKIDVLSGHDTGGGYWLWFDDRPAGPLNDWEMKTILSKHRHARLYVGAGLWQAIGPGQSFAAAVRRRDCPRPPSSRARLAIHLRRRLLRDWLGLYH
jgi:phosphoserine phosphatase